MSSATLDNYIRYRENPWAFLTEAVYTLDQVDKDDPIKLFPNKDYLKYYALTWQKYPLLAIPKSRRMTMSWTTIALYVWDTIFHKGRFNAFVSKKEDDAHELVQRAKFIVDNLGNKLPKDLIPEYKDKFCTLDFPSINSKIQGFPQGADQLRQFTFSGIFGDESAFWENAQEFYAASFPTIDGGGRMTLVSSPAPGFFKRLCFDAMDQIGDINTSDYVPEFKVPATGIRFWENRKNKFLIFELHYTADPDKRSEEYRESIKLSMPLKEYLREYELHWDTFQGQPVFPEFSDLHLTKEEPEPQPGLPLLIGFDFGLTPAAVVAQLQGETLFFFKEYVEVNMGAKRFVPKVISDLRMRFPTFTDLGKDFLCFIDPSGAFRADTDEYSCAQVLRDNKFRPIPGPIAWEERRQGVLDFLMTMSTEGPNFQISERGCPLSVKGFKGGYRFSDKNIEIEPNKVRPIKDAYSHPQDAIQYVCCGIKGRLRKVSRDIPKAAYFQTNNQGKDKQWLRR